MSVPDSFRAFRIDETETGHCASLVELGVDELTEGEVVLDAQYSSVNYKDALAGTGSGKILRRFPLNGGIDVAGVVLSSSDERFRPGDKVLATGSGLSETLDGGFSEICRLPGDILVPVPEALSVREAMILGTAGFTAALSLWRLENAGITPESGPVVVTGATGGVGSIAIDMLSHCGYEVHAISSKEGEFDFLHKLGAVQCISSRELHWGKRPLEKGIWAAALDGVGGEMLSGLTRVIQPWGSIASYGMAGGAELQTTVMPFIIRGVSLLGINSAGCSKEVRMDLWTRLADAWRPQHLDILGRYEIGLDELEDAFHRLLEGKALGRTLVRHQ